jgi:4-amino-4-deoxy-L-arabinose transferase-like glycosyltransferase
VLVLYRDDKPLWLDNRLLFLGSMLLSVWLVFMDPVLNRDAILYLRAADAYREQGLAAAMALYDRPFLSVLAAYLNQWTGLRMDLSALFILGLLYSTTVLVFIALIRNLGGDYRVQTLAAVLILAHPEVNAFRSSVVRDPGFWAFALLGVLLLLRYLQQHRLSDLAGWVLALSAATLFRFEGLFLMAAAPLLLLLAAEHDRWRLLAPLLLALAALVALGLGAWLALSDQQLNFEHIAVYIGQALTWQEQFSASSEGVADQLLRLTSVDDAPVAVVGALFAVLMITLARALMWPAILLWVAGWWRGGALNWTRGQHCVIWGHAAVCFVYLTLFLFTNSFVVERYTGLLVLLLLLPLPFWLAGLWDLNRVTVRVLIVVILGGLAIDTLHNADYRKAFISDATDWMRRNAPVNAPLLTNEPHLAYFSGRPVNFDLHQPQVDFFDTLRLRPGLPRAHHYLALNVRKRDARFAEQLLNDAAMRELAVFGGNRFGTLRILQNRDYAPLLNVAGVLERAVPGPAVILTNEKALLEMLPGRFRVQWHENLAQASPDVSLDPVNAVVSFHSADLPASAAPGWVGGVVEVVEIKGEDGRRWVVKLLDGL